MPFLYVIHKSTVEKLKAIFSLHAKDIVEKKFWVRIAQYFSSAVVTKKGKTYRKCNINKKESRE